MSQNRMLLIGINAYPGCALAGCRNDISDVDSVIPAKFAFDQTNVHILLDGAATAQNIINECVWLSQTPGGARAYLHYSGHGAQNPSPNDPNKVDDVICPVNFDWTQDRMITSEQFVQIFVKMVAGVKFNWVSDSCHSGGLDRGFHNGGKKQTPKFIVAPSAIQHEITKRKIAQRHVHLREMINNHINVGFISGCRSDQTSADTEVNGRPCGALTHYYLQSLQTMYAMSLNLFVPALQKTLYDEGYDQQPVGDGPRMNLPMLG